MEIPERLGWLAGHAGGAAWLRRLPALVHEVAERWALTLGDPFPDGYVSLVCPARPRDGTDAVLKVQYPHPECREEASALREWGGDGAVRLLAHDPVRHALLLERCRPGLALASVAADPALDVFVDLLPRLWRPLGPDAPYDRLSDVAQGWAATLPDRWEEAGRPCERRLVDAACLLAVDLAADLAGPAADQLVLVNQDLHGDNVLAAERAPWLVIDPKPLAGERAFGLSPIVRAYEFGHAPAAVRHRLDRTAAELGVDRERARGWTIAQAVAWAIGADHVVRAHHLDTARWLLDG